MAVDAGGLPGQRAFVDLHCHTSASFDSLADPRAVVRAAVARGLTHIAITDHDRIDGALEAREIVARAAANGSASLTIIIGEEVRTADGDLIALFLDRPVPPGMSARETVAAVREQGGLVGIPHPFDRFRGTLARDEGMREVVPLVDWVETYNARLVGRGNEQAATLAAEHHLPGVAVSDAHTILEIAVAYTILSGDPSTADGLRAALAGAELVPGRASVIARLFTPIAKLVQRARGNGRVSRSAGKPGGPAVSGAPR
ncbi:MAG: PHP domain-containing protein [Chloroflexota bacterium]|nr:PHP domain-containing protein [Chloroflexota bacterium]